MKGFIETGHLGGIGQLGHGGSNAGQVGRIVQWRQVGVFFDRLNDLLVNCDYSLTMLEKSKEKFDAALYEGSFSFISGDAERLPFKDGSFDIIAMNAVLHHLPNYALCITEIDRVLKKGGIVAIAHEQNTDLLKSKLFSGLAMLYKIIGGGMGASSALAASWDWGMRRR